MRPRELFGVGVRLLAVWFWTQAAYWGYWAAMKATNTDMGNPPISQREDMGYMVLYLLLGFALMRGANGLVWVAYGDAPKPSALDTGSSGGPGSLGETAPTTQ
jgi:hypothetical protein